MSAPHIFQKSKKASKPEIGAEEGGQDWQCMTLGPTIPHHPLRSGLCCDAVRGTLHCKNNTSTTPTPGWLYCNCKRDSCTMPSTATRRGAVIKGPPCRATCSTCYFLCSTSTRLSSWQVQCQVSSQYCRMDSCVRASLSIQNYKSVPIKLSSLIAKHV